MATDPKRRAFNKLVALRPYSFGTVPDLTDTDTLAAFRAACSALLHLSKEERAQVLKAVEAYEGTLS